MSDEVATNAWNANYGISLPENVNATHNASLSPLFLNKSGEVMSDSRVAFVVGQYGCSWSTNTAITGLVSASHLTIAADTSMPSSKDGRMYGYPLRCLVSTNNR